MALNFVQANAECSGLPRQSFDLVYSSAMLHETSSKALPRIMAECFRVLRPGGVMVHLEVPFRAERPTPTTLVRADFETRFNNEPFWMGAVSGRLRRTREARPASPTSTPASRTPPSARRQRDKVKGMFCNVNKGGYKSWYIASARKPRS